MTPGVDYPKTVIGWLVFLPMLLLVAAMGCSALLMVLLACKFLWLALTV